MANIAKIIDQAWQAMNENKKAEQAAVQEQVQKVTEKKSTQAPAQKPVQTVKPVDNRTTAQKVADSQAAYDSYMGSEEKKQNQQAANRKALQETIDRLFAVPGTTMGEMPLSVASPVPVDRKEQELKATANYYKGQQQAEQDRAVMDADLKEYESWSEQDKADLDHYITERDRNQSNLFDAPQFDTYNLNPLVQKYGFGKVRQMAESLQRSRNEQTMAQAQAAAEKAAQESPVAGSIASVGANLIGSYTGTIESFKEAANRTGRYQTMDPNNLGGLASEYGGTVRKGVAQRIEGEDGNWLRKIAAIGYEGLMSAADSTARMAAGGFNPGVSAAIAASGSFGNSLRQYSAQGASPEQAAAAALVTSGIEYLTEKIPMDELLKVGKSGSAVKDVLKQAFLTEPTTEEISLFGNVLAEAVILGKKSDRSQRIGELIAGGASYEDAQKQVNQELLNEAARTYAVSAISGGLSAGGTAIVNGSQNQPMSIQEAMDSVVASYMPNITKEQPVQQTEQQRAMQRAADEVMGVKPVEQTAEVAPAQPEIAGSKEHISMEDYANNESPVWRNVAYEDDATKASITQQLHDDMVESGNVVQIAEAVSKNVDETLPDLRGMKKAERGPILRQAISAIKANLRQYLGGLTNQNFEFEVNGKILDAKLYNTGIKEVLEKVTNEKAKMLYTTEDIFRNARYLYSTPDYDGDPNVYRWNYFYTPVKIGEETVGVRIAVRDMANPQESQVYNWNIKKDAPFGGVGRGKNNRISNDATSSTSNDIITEPGAEVKGTGAAEQNFSGKAEYQDLLYEGNVQRDRQGDVRPMEVPKTDSYGRNVSEFVGNAYGAEITPDSMASEIETLVQEGALGYDRRSNQDALNDAAREIETKGAYNIRSQITKNVANGKIKDGDIEKALLLYAKYANKNGQAAQNSASEIFVDLTTMSHMTGRNLQLFGLLRKLTPEGQAMTIKKMVQQNVESMIRSGQVKGDYVTEVSPELLRDYREAARENMRAVSEEQKEQSAEKMRQIQQAIFAEEAAKMPATFKAKWDAWRYMAMLGNAKTQMRNVFGNALFVPYKEAKDKLASIFEKALPKEQRTKSFGTDSELLAWAQNDSRAEDVKNALKYSGKLGDDTTSAQFAENKRVFDTEALETVRKFVEKVPQKGDMVFKNGYYARSLAGFLKARGYDLNAVQNGTVSDAVMAEARGYAIQEAMKATFNDSNAFSDAFASLGRKNTDNPWSKALNVAAEGILPFRRTPANIVVRFTEYSPVGLAKGVWDMATKVKDGQISAAAAIDQISAGMTGSAAMILGYSLAKGMFGIKITGSGTDEDEKRQGHQDYALEFSINGQEYSYKIDWAAPANLPLFVGANLYKAIEEAGGNTDVSVFTSILHSMGTMFEPMLALSCMSSLNDLVEGIRYAPKGEALYTIAADVATSYFTQGIPALARQAYQATQKNKQTTFANSADPTIRDLQKTGANIPFVGVAFQTDKVNAWGETETTESGVMRAFNAFINPGTYKAIDNGALETEINRLNEAQNVNVSPPTAEKTVSYTDTSGEIHKNVRLTEEQYQTMARTQGQTAAKLLDRLIYNPNYRALTDQQKAYAIDAVYQYAREQGRAAALSDYHSEADSWIKEVADGDISAFISRGASGPLQTAVDNAVAALANGWKVTGADKKAMNESYSGYTKLSDDAKQRIQEQMDSDVKKFVEMRAAGISTEKFLDATQTLKNLQPEEGMKNPRSVQKAEAFANISGFTESQREMMVKMEVSDAQDENIDQLKKMGYSIEDFAKLYRDHEDYTHGTGKKARTIKKWMKDYGISYNAAKQLYEVFS